MEWPEFRARWGCPFRDTKVKIETRKVFVDFPNYTIEHIYRVLCEEGRKEPDKDKLYQNIKDICKSINQELEEIGFNFLTFYPVKSRSPKYFVGIRYKVNWRKYEEFLNKLSTKSLTYCYEYINRQSRFVALQLGHQLNDKDTQQSVKKLVQNDILKIKQNLNDFIKKVKILRNNLWKLGNTQRFSRDFSLFWYLTELESNLKTVRYLLSNGYVTAIYRELRKTIENSSWCIADDIFFYNSGFSASEQKDIFFRTYIDISKRWFKYCKDKNAIIRHLGDLEEKINELTNIIYYWKGGKIEKNKIKNFIWRNISYPFLVSWFNKPAKKNLKESLDDGIVHVYKKEELRDCLENNLYFFLTKLLNKRKLSKNDLKLIEELINYFLPQYREILPYLPSNQFIIQFLDKLFNIKLFDMYSKYSSFVHSYVSSWQVLSFSSVLEFKLLNQEINKFTKNMEELFEKYLEKLRTI